MSKKTILYYERQNVYMAKCSAYHEIKLETNNKSLNAKLNNLENSNTNNKN